MKYSDLVENGAADTEKQEFLVGGDMAAITIRIPENLRRAGKEAAALRDQLQRIHPHVRDRRAYEEGTVASGRYQEAREGTVGSGR